MRHTGTVIVSSAWLALSAAFAAPAAAQGPALPVGGRQTYTPLEAPYSRYYCTVSGAASVPVGGHWGDGDVGFRPSPALTLGAGKKVDDLLSYGLETGYSFAYRNYDVGALRVRLFSFSPFVRAAFQEGEKTYYGLFGAGIYQWTQPAFSSGGKEYSSDSGSSFGFTLAGGSIFPLKGPFKLGAELRWQHIFNMKGDNFDLSTADNIAPSVVLLYGF